MSKVIGIDYKEILAEKQKINAKGGRFLIYHSWKITWYYEKEFRDILISKGIKLANEVAPVGGFIHVNPKDYIKGEYEAMQFIDLFKV